MERDRKPDLSGHVNGLDIHIFRRDSGVEISVEQEGVEVVLFRYSPQEVRKDVETTTLSPAPVSVTPVPQSTSLETSSQQSQEVKTPVKIAGIVEAIEGMGETPTRGDPVFRFSVKRMNPQTSREEVLQIAAFREIAQGLNQFYTSPDPAVKLQPGRSISMMAWDHTAKTGSYYPQSVNYLTFPALTYQKPQQKR